MSSITRRLALAALMTTTCATGALAQEKKTLIVAEPVHGTGYLPLYVAIQKGFFSDQGLDVKILTIESGSGHTNAVLSGQAFAFIGGPEHDAFAKLKGAELRAVVNVVDRGNVYYVAKKGSEPAAGQSMADYFKGKTIAPGPYGGTPNSITRYLLKKYGLDATKDATLVETTSSAVIAAVKTGQAQIGNVTEPFITRGIKEGIFGEPFLQIPTELGPYAYSTLNVRLESITKDPETVQKFVTGVSKGLAYTFANPEEAIKMAKKEFPTMADEDIAATVNRSLKDEMWSKETAQAVVREAGILKADVPYDDIIDMQFMKGKGATN
jgi:NitT/TauT family transport system substrate-binding protein